MLGLLAAFIGGIGLLFPQVIIENIIMTELIHNAHKSQQNDDIIYVHQEIKDNKEVIPREIPKLIPKFNIPFALFFILIIIVLMIAIPITLI